MYKVTSTPVLKDMPALRCTNLHGFVKGERNVILCTEETTDDDLNGTVEGGRMVSYDEQRGQGSWMREGREGVG